MIVMLVIMSVVITLALGYFAVTTIDAFRKGR